MPHTENESRPTYASVPGMCLSALGRHAKPDALNLKREGQWLHIPGRAIVERVRAVAMGLSALGVRKGDRVALLSENRPDWSVTDLAILSLGAVNVPIYTTQAPDQVRYILEDSGARVAEDLFPRDEEDARARVFEDVAHLVGRLRRVDGDVDGAEAEDGDVHDRPVGAVLGEQGHAVAPLHAERREPEGDGAHAPDDRRARDVEPLPALLEAQRVRLRVPPQRLQAHPRHARRRRRIFSKLRHNLVLSAED